MVELIATAVIAAIAGAGMYLVLRGILAFVQSRRIAAETRIELVRQHGDLAEKFLASTEDRDVDYLREAVSRMCWAMTEPNLTTLLLRLAFKPADRRERQDDIETRVRPELDRLTEHESRLFGEMAGIAMLAASYNSLVLGPVIRRGITLMSVRQRHGDRDRGRIE